MPSPVSAAPDGVVLALAFIVRPRIELGAPTALSAKDSSRNERGPHDSPTAPADDSPGLAKSGESSRCETPPPEATVDRGTSSSEEQEPGGSISPKRQSTAPTLSRAAIYRFAVMGTELAGSALAGAGIGYVIDSAGEHSKAYATAIGTLIGFTLGMIRFVREVKPPSDH